MQSEPSEVQVELAPSFRRKLRILAKRYRKIRNDIQPLIEQLQAGEFPGDRIPEIRFEVFKVRVRNSDIQKGKSGGYRVIYYVKTLDRIILAAIYSKSDQDDITAKEIEDILSGFE